MTKAYVTRDRELEAVQARSLAELAAHRWHWTLDESNPERVTLREYARQVGRGNPRIHAHAHGYANWKAAPAHGSSPGAPTTLNDYIEHAKMSAEKAEATEAVAKATGTAFTTAASHKRPEVRQVLDQARDRAERRGTKLSEEIERVAEWRESARRAEANEKAEIARTKSVMLVRLEGHLGSAIRDLREALAVARDIDFAAEQVELIAGTLASLRTIVGLIDVRLTGNAGVDWDRDFADFMEEAS